MIKYSLKMGTNNLKPNQIPKILDVTLDTKLTFNATYRQHSKEN